MQENVEKMLRELASKLGTTTEKLYSVLVKQSKINALINLMYIVFVISVAIVLWNMLENVHWLDSTIVKTNYGIKEIYPDSNTSFLFVWGANIICWVFAVFSIPNYISSIISNLLNPEYSAIKEILYAITPYED